jgi:hypothetical protein
MLLDRGRSGGRARLVLILALVGIYWSLVTLVLDYPPLIPAETLGQFPLLIAILLDVGTSFVHPQVLASVAPVGLAGLLALHLGAAYLTALFELESTRIAYHYLLGAVFGLSYPVLTIDRGRVEALDQANPLVRIGGPGYLNLHLGFAAVFETLEGQPRIYGPTHQRSEFFIQGFERLREVIDLRDQFRQLDEVRTVTKDGIVVHARDVQIVFRAYGGEPRTAGSPLPVETRSVLSLAYGGQVSESGPSHWTDTLPELARQELKAFVAARSLEEFLALPQPASDPGRPRRTQVHIPRRELTESFHSPARRARLKDLGLELVWLGVGTWEVRDDQLPATDLEVAAGHTLTGVARDALRARRLAAPDHLARHHQLQAFALTQDVIEEVLAAWGNGRPPGRADLSGLLDRLRRRLIDLKSRVEDQHRIDPASEEVLEVPERLSEVVLHLESLIERSPAR